MLCLILVRLRRFANLGAGHGQKSSERVPHGGDTWGAGNDRRDRRDRSDERSQHKSDRGELAEPSGRDEPPMFVAYEMVVTQPPLSERLGPAGFFPLGDGISVPEGVLNAETLANGYRMTVPNVSVRTLCSSRHVPCLLCSIDVV